MLIVIVIVPETPEPSLAVAIAVTKPLSIAVNRPVLLMMACPVPFKTVQMIVLFVAFIGKTDSFNWRVPLSVEMVVTPPDPEIEIPVTGITWLEIFIANVSKHLNYHSPLLLLLQCHLLLR